MITVSFDPRRGNGDFQRVVNSLLLGKGLPAAEIERIFRRRDALFGETYNSVYNTAVVLWAFLSQVLADGKMRSCTAAVARVIGFAILTEQDPPSTDTSAYCRARHKLDEKALYDLVVELVTWKRPKRPEWMDEAAYETIPKTLTLRMTQFNIVEPGCRTKSVTIVSTLVDAELYSKQDIAELYGFRWNVEVDILHIKQTLNLDHLRCKTPDMVRKEFWTTLLAYNLIRRIICAAATEHGKLPRRISFTRTCTTILTAWSNLSLGLYVPKALKLLLEQIASLKTPHRPGRFEPRVLKRRRHRYPLMRKPRKRLKQRLKSTTRSSKMT